MRNYRVAEVGVVLSLSVLLLLTLVPFAMLLFLSFKDHLDIVVDFWGIPEGLKWENYSTAWSAVSGSIGNSLFVCCVTVAGAVLISSMAGYSFARNRFPGKEILFMLIISVMLIPSMLNIVPLYAIISQLNLTDSFWGLILPYISGTQLVGIILCRTFFQGIPEELFEAARMDGAGEAYLYLRIALPLSMPVIATLGIITFISVYSDYLWPLIILKEPHLTFTIQAVNMTTNGRPDLGLSFAAYIIGSLPMILVIMFGMKYFVQGITSGALKS
ncbi:carbohydrate ABC transporter permease [Cohnella sp. LGH]|uniref:Multiple sugar transport system permease protein n=1 Tax=Cohnella phaseoli TaxID=456490 RepID=A0A3D9IUE4_9BACL|nr:MULTISPECIES: carbohydrate ABC transporter permease [Cohnella]QTH40590.1 carbohydrate ABC transporter permease [Cohnella sp. LGH]RED65315.1 multiple sugar transport system permease protein [Cohnella phaseoli]